MSAFSNRFPLETTGPISVKFHMQPADKGGKKVYIFGPGHMTKVGTVPIHSKNFKKTSPGPGCSKHR